MLCCRPSNHYYFLFIAAATVAVAMGSLPRFIPHLPALQPASSTPVRVIASPLRPPLTAVSLGSTAGLLHPPAASVSRTPPVIADSSLLPSEDAMPLVSTEVPTSVPTAPAGVLMGDGLAPLPQKLIKCILQLEFIISYHGGSASPSKGPVTDIAVWVQCYATLVSTLSIQYPNKAPEFTAYLATIVRCQRDYEGPAWVLYDWAFRRRVEATKDLQWSVINTSLFNMCFGGRARRHTLCQLYLSEQHTANACPRRVVALGYAQPLIYYISGLDLRGDLPSDLPCSPEASSGARSCIH